MQIRNMFQYIDKQEPNTLHNTKKIHSLNLYR